MSVFSLHSIRSEEPSTLPFAPKDYARFKFGDDGSAHRFGSQLAQAFIAEKLGVFQDSSKDIVVAAASDYVPSATHALRQHFVAYLNRHLITTDCKPAQKIDIYRQKERGVIECAGTRDQKQPKSTFHIDRERVGGQILIVVDDLRSTQAQEEELNRTFKGPHLPAKVFFVYLAEIADPKVASSVTKSLAFPSVHVKDVEAIAQSRSFVMSSTCVEFVLLLGHVEFCQFIRRQDDGFVQLLLDYAIGGYYHADPRCLENFKFLLWEAKAREFSGSV
ncbi:hypothetical protein BS50DRAFT_53674 [Corynespora cassiicola Philippines]|uniref:PRTase ComF-like protein n=1 Tax=Corynespora cassiicola Philippines TaxID=1448308 RepID=A0A2T2NIH2_CORCC|nr:hypothetical protein BS50DRAFT_53674 [Corynespora cassiicola Philippines]